MSFIGKVVVTVGAELDIPGGIFQFNPNTISAPNGTNVEFIFSGSPGNHSVTQSSFANPCTPLVGGVDSGFQEVLASNTGGPFPAWSFTVNNDKLPLWLFCRQSIPASHCHAGMVAVVNIDESSGKTFAAFQAAAALKPSPTTQSTLLGPSLHQKSPLHGTSSAFSQPTSSGSSVDPISASRHSSSTSKLSQATNNALPGGTHVPITAIAGPTVAALVVLILCIVAFLVCRRRRASRNNGPRPLGRRRVSTLLDFEEDNRVDTRPEPWILHEKNFPSSAVASTSGQSNELTSALPTAAELAMVSMEEEMRVLRDQLPGGIDSGFITGAAADDPKVPEWSFTLIDDRRPAWFFCRQTVNVSHCHAGMVLAVNADPDTFAAFQRAAEASSTSSSQRPSTQTKVKVSPTVASASATSSSLGANTPATSTPSASVSPPARKHVPVTAIAGSVVAVSAVILLCIAALLVRRRRASRNNGPRPLGLRRASTLLELAEDNRIDTRPEPLILYEKDARYLAVTSSAPSSTNSSSSSLPTGAELALVTMAEEMRLLRGQVQRLERDRQGSTIETAEEEMPPEYATTR
ncbi:hypothetical protein FB451DRAFT_1567783 [Mycena latifolia]|nr:hypothetical protein FB451DRAFT_1567783 [Mycena latifolia]